MQGIRVKLSKGGEVTIPAQLRDTLGWHEGDELALYVEDGGLRISTAQAAIERAQALVRKYVPEGRLLAEELIAARRLEARGE